MASWISSRIASRVIPAAAALAAGLLLPTVAAATPPAVTSGTITASSIFDCTTFAIRFDETNQYTERDFYDQNGVFVRAISKVKASDVDTNLSTGKSIAVRSEYTVTDYADGTETVSGLFWMANDPGHGNVIHDVGRILFAADGSFVLKGLHEVMSGSEAVFCSAVTSDPR
jgi:hypothetical protein